MTVGKTHIEERSVTFRNADDLSGAEFGVHQTAFFAIIGVIKIAVARVGLLRNSDSGETRIDVISHVGMRLPGYPSRSR